MRIVVDKWIPQFLQEAGGHRIQRVPRSEKRGRVHTSTVTVAVLEHERSADITLEESDLHYRWYSGTGPGGQNRNKVQCCLELTHLPTGLKQQAHSRSRTDNAINARRALLEALNEATAQAHRHERNAIRSEQIGLGMRADKIRTYRFQDDIVTDHNSGKRASARAIMSGKLEKLWR